MKRFMQIVTAVLIGLMIAAIVYYKSDKKVSASISASDIYSEFETDEKAANQKYMSKVLIISGVLDDKYVDEQGHSVVILSEEVGDPKALVTLRKGEDKHLIGYEIGDKMSVRGDCTGYLMEVTFKDGTIE